MNVLVTGGAGYIGSHTLIQLIENGYSPIVFDSLVNSSKESINRVEQITGTTIPFIQGDICNIDAIRLLFKSFDFKAVIHFAGLKAVGESCQKPNIYYQCNVSGTICLLRVMEEFEVNKLIFSSSATIYGMESKIPYIETMMAGTPSSPYGASKIIVEQILNDNCFANSKLQFISLRYFNPIGAHSSGLIGEDPQGIPNNLLPFIAQVAVGKRKKLEIFGNDYATNDGTCRRDYLHVVDLAQGHVDALSWLFNNVDFKGFEAFNLGTGSPRSVLEIVRCFEYETGIKIPFQFSPRRPGDLAEFWADVTKSKSILGWEAKYSLSDMMRDTWNWQSKNPNGFKQ